MSVDFRLKLTNFLLLKTFCITFDSLSHTENSLAKFMRIFFYCFVNKQPKTFSVSYLWVAETVMRQIAGVTPDALLAISSDGKLHRIKSKAVRILSYLIDGCCSNKFHILTRIYSIAIPVNLRISFSVLLR